VKEVDLDTLTILLGFTLPHYENVMSVCMDELMCASPAPERLVGFYSYLVFKSLSILG
jgi:hypothetical protein